MLNRPHLVGKLSDYNPHPGQKKLHSSTAKEIIITSSIRSGKTYGFVHDIIMTAWNNKTGFGVLCCAPTYNLLENLLEREIVSWFERNNLLKNHSFSKHTTTLKNGNMIYFRSLEDPDKALRGLNISAAYIDEAAYCTKYAIDVVKGRLLLTNGQLKMATTPAGLNNWVYTDYFAKRRDDVDYIEFQLRDNPLLTEESINRLYASYDPLMAQQELEGKFVNLYGSRVYYSFEESNIINTDSLRGILTGARKIIGLDYNVGINAMIWLVKMSDNRLIVTGEKTGLVTLPEVAAFIQSNFNQNYSLVDDAASGTNRSLQDARTPREYLRQSGINNIIERTSNTSILSRVSLVNSLFKNALGQRLLYIDSNCTELISELRALSYIQGKDKVDTQGGKMGHISDALGYAVQHATGNTISQTPQLQDPILSRFGQKGLQSVANFL